jgi:hypothetical protein
MYEMQWLVISISKLHNNQNLEYDHNLLAILQNMVLTKQLPNYINLRNITEKGDVQRTPSKVKIP